MTAAGGVIGAVSSLVGIGGGRFMALRIEAHPSTGADTQRVALYVHGLRRRREQPA